MLTPQVSLSYLHIYYNIYFYKNQMLFFMVVLPGVEPRSCPYKEPALTIELQDYMARQGGFEPPVRITPNDSLAGS